MCFNKKTIDSVIFPYLCFKCYLILVVTATTATTGESNRRGSGWLVGVLWPMNPC